MSELKPCPFCDVNEWKYQSHFSGTTIYQCEKCGTIVEEWVINIRPIEDALTARIAKLEDEIAKMKKYFHKPEHGSCCTCQKCGHIYDECRCDFDETYDENDILTARNAELEAFVNRLIEAGNTMVFETFEGYKKHGLFDFAPVNTWQVLVKDWKERGE